MDTYARIKQLLSDKYSHLGFEESAGSVLIGKAPHIGSMAWLHKFFKGMEEFEIAEIEAHLEISLPLDLKNFYRQSNGMKIFTRTLDLDGIRRNNSRDPLNHQPFDIFNPNKRERPNNSQKSFFFFGAYGYDLSKVYVNTTNGKIFACDRWDAQNIICSWANFDLFLESEVHRLIELFDLNGLPKYESEALTLP